VLFRSIIRDDRRLRRSVALPRLVTKNLQGGLSRIAMSTCLIRCAVALSMTLAWFLVLADASPAADKVSSCIECHQSMPGPRLADLVKAYADDIHTAKGFGCQDCHGGDPTRGAAEGDPDLAHDAAKGFVGAPTPAQTPGFCARCHSDVEFMKKYNPKLRVDQLLEYRSSRHGKSLASGDTKVATCVSCHGVHGILAVSDTRSPVYKTNVANTCARCHADAAYMRPYGIPTNQLELYKSSVHGQRLLEKGDLAAPTCNNCHGNHGATPPGLTSIANACGECHANNRDFFNESPHKAAFANMGLGECTACHRHHDIAKPTDAMLGTGQGSLCTTCHSDGDPGFAAAAEMTKTIDSLKVTLTAAHDLLDRAARGGIDVALGKFDLHAAYDALIKARTAVHYFDTTKFAEVVAPGVAAAGQVILLGNEALADLRMRYVGLGFSIPLVLLVALLLYLKIRRMERDKPLA
jgi:predicted CXXCH cytochrome family protein